MILYCEKCGQRLSAEDVQAGRASALCAKCLQAQSGAKVLHSQGGAKAPHSQSGAKAPHSKAAAAQASSARWLVTAGISAAGLGLLLLALTMLRSHKAGARRADQPSAQAKQPVPHSGTAAAPSPKAEQPPQAKPDAATAGPAKAEAQPAGGAKSRPATDDYDPRALVASSLLDQAKRCLQEHPEDLWTYREKLQEVPARFPGTPGAAEAARLLAQTPEPKPDPNLPGEEAWKRAVNLLALANPERDSLGRWTKNQGALASSGEKEERLSLPYIPPEEYDVRIVFSRSVSNEAMGVGLVRDGRAFAFVVSGWDNVATGFEIIQGKRAQDLPSSCKTRGLIQNGRRYTLVLQIRRECLRAYLNNRLVSECRPASQDLSSFTEQEMFKFKPGQLGIATWYSPYEFQQIEVLEVTGKGKVLTGE
ncbi:MAG: hypothetical protein ABSE73_08080 [Planctomycetota bacterium]